MFGVPLRPPYGVVTEVAWWDLTTGEHGSFVPRHDVQTVRGYGDIASLTVSRYLERLATAEQDDGTEVDALHERLTGATLAGANPTFDARFLRELFKDHDDHEPWHYRLLDVSAWAAGALELPGSKLPGLRDICERLGIDPPDHTAAGDVRAAGEALYALGAVARPSGTP